MSLLRQRKSTGTSNATESDPNIYQEDDKKNKEIADNFTISFSLLFF